MSWLMYLDSMPVLTRLLLKKLRLVQPWKGLCLSSVMKRSDGPKTLLSLLPNCKPTSQLLTKIWKVHCEYCEKLLPNWETVSWCRNILSSGTSSAARVTRLPVGRPSTIWARSWPSRSLKVLHRLPWRSKEPLPIIAAKGKVKGHKYR